MRCVSVLHRASLVAQSVKNLPAVQETQVWSLGWEDPLEKEMAAHSRTLAWKISWTEEPGGLQSMGSQRARHDWATNTHSVLHQAITSGCHWVAALYLIVILSLSFLIFFLFNKNRHYQIKKKNVSNCSGHARKFSLDVKWETFIYIYTHTYIFNVFFSSKSKSYSLSKT